VSGSSFYAGMRILPKTEREAMFAIYGFCRMVDDIADDQQTPVSNARRWTNGGRASGALSRRRCGRGGLPERPCAISTFSRRISWRSSPGMRMDVDGDVRWPDFATFDLYCDRVASAVGACRSMSSAWTGRWAWNCPIILAARCSSPTSCATLTRMSASAASIFPSRRCARRASRLSPERWCRAQSGCRPLAGPLRAGAFREAARILKSRPKGHLVAPRLMESAYARILRAWWRGVERAARRVGTSKWRLVLALIRFTLWR
jgi:phytoene synthase